MHHKTLIFLILVLNSCSIDPDIRAHGMLISTVTKEAKENYNLYLYGSGSALFNKGLGFSFISFDALRVDEARLLAVLLFEDLLHQIHSDCQLQPYLRPVNFDTKNLELSIAFQQFDQPNESIDPPNIAFLDIGNDEIFYSVYNPSDEGLYTIHKESYQQAKDIAENHIALIKGIVGDDINFDQTKDSRRMKRAHIEMDIFWIQRNEGKRFIERYGNDKVL